LGGLVNRSSVEVTHREERRVVGIAFTFKVESEESRSATYARYMEDSRDINHESSPKVVVLTRRYPFGRFMSEDYLLRLRQAAV
jgi:hypothetical protein